MSKRLCPRACLSIGYYSQLNFPLLVGDAIPGSLRLAALPTGSKWCILLQDSHSQLAESQLTSPPRGTKQQQLLLPQQHEDSAEEFKFTLAAARRTELRRLRSFVKMADYMMCDTLQQVWMAPCRLIRTTDGLVAMLSGQHVLAGSWLHAPGAAVLSM